MNALWRPLIRLYALPAWLGLVLMASACSEPTRSEPVAGVEIVAPFPFVDVGHEVQLTATTRSASGEVLSDKKVAWSSDNQAVATVSPSGVVRGVSLGTAVITATSGEASATVNVTVEPVVANLAVLHETNVLSLSRSLRPRVFLSGSGVGSPSLIHSVRLTSSDTSVLAVSSGVTDPTGRAGVIRGVGIGSATLTIAAGSKSEKIEFTVERPYALTILRTSTSSLILPTAINASGQVVLNDRDEAFLWDKGQLVSLGQGAAWDLNDRGEIVGSSGLQRAAVIWHHGSKRVLYSKVHEFAEATGINRHGHVVGFSTCSSKLCLRGTSFVIRGDTLRELPSYASGVPRLEPEAINDAGWIVGALASRTDAQAFLYRDGVVTNLPPVEGNSRARDINDAGVIVGNPRLESAFRVLLWEGTAPVELEMPPPGPAFGATGEGINNLGDIVGSVNRHAYLWRKRKPANLQYLHSDTTWTMERATDINDQGQIIAVASNKATGQWAAVLLTPPR
jgi:hypothetical protein